MHTSQNGSRERPPRLPDGAPLDYAPNNEQGVIYLFSYLAREKFGLHIEKIRAGFPDCIAYRQGKRIRIEFEYRSHNFCTHKHCIRDCDWIVCWIHDWPGVPSRIRVVELRKEFGLGFNVWFQPIQPKYAQRLRKINYDNLWSVPRASMQGDLLLIYTSGLGGCIRDIFKVAGPVAHVKAGWKPGRDWAAPIRRVCSLDAPVYHREVKDHPILRTAGFVRGKMRARCNVSEYWPELHRMLMTRNPSVKRQLVKFGPERLW